MEKKLKNYCKKSTNNTKNNTMSTKKSQENN